MLPNFLGQHPIGNFQRHAECQICKLHKPLCIVFHIPSSITATVVQLWELCAKGMSCLSNASPQICHGVTIFEEQLGHGLREALVKEYVPLWQDVAGNNLGRPNIHPCWSVTGWPWNSTIRQWTRRRSSREPCTQPASVGDMIWIYSVSLTSACAWITSLML